MLAREAELLDKMMTKQKTENNSHMVAGDGGGPPEVLVHGGGDVEEEKIIKVCRIPHIPLVMYIINTSIYDLN